MCSFSFLRRKVLLWELPIHVFRALPRKSSRSRPEHSQRSTRRESQAIPRGATPQQCWRRSALLTFGCIPQTHMTAVPITTVPAPAIGCSRRAKSCNIGIRRGIESSSLLVDPQTDLLPFISLHSVPASCRNTEIEKGFISIYTVSESPIWAQPIARKPLLKMHAECFKPRMVPFNHPF